MRDVYEYCPEFENDKYLLRLISTEDTKDLLKVYSDDRAVPFFNSDNCEGDDFYYETLERMKQAVGSRFLDIFLQRKIFCKMDYY